jgi:CRP-like cAMP-binding protein
MRSLHSIALLASLPDERLAAVERLCRWHQRDTGQSLITYRDPSTDVYFLTAGKVRAVIYSAAGKAVAFRDHGPGDTFGELAAVDGRSRSASIEALEPCTIASLGASAFRRVLQDEPLVAQELMVHLTRLVRILTDRVYEFSTLAVSNRIQAELLRLSRGAEQADGSALISPAPLQADIAERISTHREAVAREFSRLASVGVVARRGKALLITDVKRLARMVSEASEE